MHYTNHKTSDFSFSKWYMDCVDIKGNVFIGYSAVLKWEKIKLNYASILYHDYFPEIAERETRTISVFDNSSWDLPPAHYSLLEMYCDEPDCDCRRVFFYVVSSLTRQAVAVIAYGWESRKFYSKWFGDDDPKIIEELKGPALNLASPQSEIAPLILEMVQEVVLQDRAYIQRVKNHYRMFRNRIDTNIDRKTKRKKRKKKKR
jgi:hypothetical protein